MKDLLMIVPSRGRPEKIEACIDAWLNTRENSDLLVCLDEDDPELNNYYHHRQVKYDVGERIRLCPTVNRAVKDHPGYKYYGFIGDDHLFRTIGWDTKMMDEIESHGGWGIAYGDDLLKGRSLATHCVMSANIPKALGYMAIPGLQHMYMDDFWMEIGNNLGILYYLPDVVVEHMHFSNGKSEKDEIYKESNDSSIPGDDFRVFEVWKESQMDTDLEKIRNAMREAINQ